MNQRQNKIINQCKDRLLIESKKLLSGEITQEDFNRVSEKIEEYLTQNNIPISLFVNKTNN